MTAKNKIAIVLLLIAVMSILPLTSLAEVYKAELIVDAPGNVRLSGWLNTTVTSYTQFLGLDSGGIVVNEFYIVLANGTIITVRKGDELAIYFDDSSATKNTTGVVEVDLTFDITFYSKHYRLIISNMSVDSIVVNGQTVATNTFITYAYIAINISNTISTLTVQVLPRPESNRTLYINNTLVDTTTRSLIRLMNITPYAEPTIILPEKYTINMLTVKLNSGGGGYAKGLVDNYVVGGGGGRRPGKGRPFTTP